MEVFSIALRGIIKYAIKGTQFYMNLFRFLLRSSWVTLTLAVLAGLLSGACNAGLIALINKTLSKPSSFPAAIAWGFAGLCLLQVFMNASAEALLIRISQNAVCNLKINCSVTSALSQRESRNSSFIASAV